LLERCDEIALTFTGRCIRITDSYGSCSGMLFANVGNLLLNGLSLTAKNTPTEINGLLHHLIVGINWKSDGLFNRDEIVA
jgi:hypothetical protein